MTARELIGHWRAEAAVLRRRGASTLADVLEQCAAELDAAQAAEETATLTVREAADLSGYSQSQLRRRFPGQREIRRADLPRKGAQHRDPVDELVERRLRAS